mgnify:CR=1 FL=1
MVLLGSICAACTAACTTVFTCNKAIWQGHGLVPTFVPVSGGRKQLSFLHAKKLPQLFEAALASCQGLSASCVES